MHLHIYIYIYIYIYVYVYTYDMHLYVFAHVCVYGSVYCTYADMQIGREMDRVVPKIIGQAWPGCSWMRTWAVLSYKALTTTSYRRQYSLRRLVSETVGFMQIETEHVLLTTAP